MEDKVLLLLDKYFLPFLVVLAVSIIILISTSVTTPTPNVPIDRVTWVEVVPPTDLLETHRCFFDRYSGLESLTCTLVR